MAKQVIGIGTTANDGTGDQARVAFDKVNDNFNEVYGNDFTTYDRLGVEFKDTNALGNITGTVAIDFSTDQIFTATLTGNTTFTVSNAQAGMVKDLYVTGDFTLAITNGAKIAGEYDGTVENFIQVVVKTPTSFKYSISQDAV